MRHQISCRTLCSLRLIFTGVSVTYKWNLKFNIGKTYFGQKVYFRDMPGWVRIKVCIFFMSPKMLKSILCVSKGGVYRVHTFEPCKISNSLETAVSSLGFNKFNIGKPILDYTWVLE